MTRPYRQERICKIEVRVTTTERDAWDAAAAAAGVSRSEWLRCCAVHALGVGLRVTAYADRGKARPEGA